MLAKEKRQVDRVSMRRYIQSTLNMTEAVTQVQQIQKQCNDVSNSERCHLVTTGESKTVLYRKQCHSFPKQVDELLDRVKEGTKEPTSTLRLLCVKFVF